MDLLALLWAVFVFFVYIGGYLSPAIGALTPNFAAIYAIVLIGAICAWILRLRASAAAPK
jgi:hypothetical protein